MKYNRLDSDGSDEPSYRVVGFDVLPHSIDKISGLETIILFPKLYLYFLAGADNECVLPDADERLQISKGTRKITFSYSVNWEASDIRWASRWDSYLGMGDVQIHWFSIVNSIVVVLFLRNIL